MLQPHDPGNALVGNAVTAIAKARKPHSPRTFTLDYDSSKIKTRNAFNREQFKKRHTVEGTLYTKGSVTLDTGVFFEHGMAELREHFARAGTATLTWLDTNEVEEIG
jgi:hypothetical protein